MNLQTLDDLMEHRRRELNALAESYGVEDPRVLDKSIQLDRIMNFYIRKKKKNIHGSMRKQAACAVER